MGQSVYPGAFQLELLYICLPDGHGVNWPGQWLSSSVAVDPPWGQTWTPLNCAFSQTWVLVLVPEVPHVSVQLLQASQGSQLPSEVNKEEAKVSRILSAVADVLKSASNHGGMNCLSGTCNRKKSPLRAGAKASSTRANFSSANSSLPCFC